MGLKDDIAAIAAEAAQKRHQDMENAKAAQMAERLKDREAATAAIDHMLSDDTIRKIVKAHADQGGTNKATIAIKNGHVTLRGSGASQERLDLTFAAKPIIASAEFDTPAARQRVAALKSEGVSVSYQYQNQTDVLLITYDYSASTK
ncbi:hypothetical protein GOB40_21035 [Sinorhizobium meliloti]|nr:hypothetical protein [Sinorhizobium meliloti]